MFIEEPRFPDSVAFGSRGRTRYRSSRIKFHGGGSNRHPEWGDYPLHFFNARYGIKKFSELWDIQTLFHVARAVNAFRFKHWVDYNTSMPKHPTFATDQFFGTGTGTNQEFQLLKVYRWGRHQMVREIYKPVIGTVKIAANGLALADGTDYTIDYTTGKVTTDATGLLTWGGDFDVPATFASDELEWDFVEVQDGTCELLVQSDVLIEETRDFL